jgi:MoaA/NifB/PqqE/SkfB family radical SAM enzyme
MLGTIFRAWGSILGGYKPFLSIELTRECPLTCPGCYAYGDQHLGGEITLRQVRDLKGQDLIDGVLNLIRKHKPAHVSLVGGEPLVRYRELDELLPQMAAMGIHTQMVTSAVRRIPPHWASIPRLTITVSIDGLQPEHDVRRKPATYERILKNIVGHQISVHCTLTHQQLVRDGYIEEFLRFWSDQPTTKRIWMSLYTPQKGENSPERLTPEDRKKAIHDLLDLKPRYSKLEMGPGVTEFYDNPPASPSECIFARLSTCVSADFEKLITPCQFGGNPDCKNCGCIASAGMDAVKRHQLPLGIRVGDIFEASFKVGAAIRHVRNVLTTKNVSR